MQRGAYHARTRDQTADDASRLASSTFLVDGGITAAYVTPE